MLLAKLRCLPDVVRFTVNHPMNRGRRARSLLRFLQWQVRSRVTNGPVAYRWVNDSRFVVTSGETGLTGNIYVGLHEFPEMGYLLHVLRPSDLFVDIGANLGAYTILACAAVGARGYAFEPVPSAYGRLLENARLNGLTERVQCLQRAIGAENGTVMFTADRASCNHVLAPGEHGDRTVAVGMTTLDNAIQGEHPAAMKIDVEGYEMLVLRGAAQTLSDTRLHSVVMELNGSGRRYGFSDSDLVDAMAAYGFGTYTYDPLARELIPLNGAAAPSENTLFVRDEAAVRELVTSAPPASVHGRLL